MTTHSQANEQQQQAILATDGPTLIIAGPGSGKTFTLVERISHLINNKGVSPESILVCTFTNNAAHEIASRVHERLVDSGLKINLSGMYIGTFHDICLRILDRFRERAGIRHGYRIIEGTSLCYIVHDNLKRFFHRAIVNMPAEICEAPAWTQAQKIIQLCNAVMEDASAVKKLKKAKSANSKAIYNAVTNYIALLAEKNVLDFSSILYKTHKLLLDNPDILAILQDEFRYFMVDEYQDTNDIQEKIIALLARKSKNLCVVGDDDQALYRFRGASIRNILEFPSLFDGSVTTQVRLTVNYRSHPDIIDLYNKWIAAQNWEDDGKSFRYEKHILPCDKEFADVAAALKITIEAADNNDENDARWHIETLKFLRALESSGKLSDWNQVAFIFSSVTNKRVLRLANFLEKNHIPVYSPRSKMFFDREEIRMALGAMLFMLRYETGQDHMFYLTPEVDTMSIAAYKDGVSKGHGANRQYVDTYYAHCVKEFIVRAKSLENKSLLTYVQEQRDYYMRFTKPVSYAFRHVLYQLFSFPLFSQMLENSAFDYRAARNLGKLSEWMGEYEAIANVYTLSPRYIKGKVIGLFGYFLSRFWQEGVAEYEDKAPVSPSGCVSFLTTHQSKGMEFPVVVCGSMDQTPRKNNDAIKKLIKDEGILSTDEFEPEYSIKHFDFWRLFYTAFSRAQNILVLSASQRKGPGTNVSSPSKSFRYLFETLPHWYDIDMSKLTLNSVKLHNLKRVYSFTAHIEKFEICPRQYQFVHEYGFTPVNKRHALFGTVVHHIIDKINKEGKLGKSITNERIEEWFNNIYKDISDASGAILTDRLKRAAIIQAQRYYASESRNMRRIIGSEKEISIDMGLYVLKGIIDIVRESEDGECVEIIDFKAEKKPKDTESDWFMQRGRRQLELYSHLVEASPEGATVQSMSLYYTGTKAGNPCISFPKEDITRAKTMSYFDGVVKRIENKEYGVVNRPSRRHCEACPMIAYCDHK